MKLYEKDYMLVTDESLIEISLTHTHTHARARNTNFVLLKHCDAMKREAAERKEDREGEVFIESER